MVDLGLLLILIPGLPLLAAVSTAALGPRWLGRRSHWPVVGALCLSLLASLTLVAEVGHEARATSGGVGFERTVTLWTWASVEEDLVGRVETRLNSDQPVRTPPGRDPAYGVPERTVRPSARVESLRIDVTLRADPLTAVMLAVVTFVSLLVAVYSIGYMHGDRGYWRFFSYLGLFVFSMTMLVSVSNFILLYVFWEAVGLCSYLLIGFWYEKPEAAAAGKKAFLVNRVGDFGFAIALFLIWIAYGTLDFHDTTIGDAVNLGVLGQTRLARPDLFVAGGAATAIGLLLMAGACGKSAQFPLHVWLPDAMEGPTPVSALIHAATMVTAGVYMVARCMPLFLASPDALRTVAAIGGFTALLAALIAMTQNDLKRILAYSTISQLGFMFLGLGAGTLLGVTAGLFHLFNHAFFKALLFLAAGSVMHAMGGVIDIRQFGGLRRRLPITYWTFLAGALALAGVFPLAGFWSKDGILVALHEQALGNEGTTFSLLLYTTALCTAGLTAFYTFRAFTRTFHGPERIPESAGDHAHESPRAMTGPLIVLAVCAVASGAAFELTHGFADFLHRTPSLAYVENHAVPNGQPSAVNTASEEHADSHLTVAIMSSAIALAGIGLAVGLNLGRRTLLGPLTTVARALGLYPLSNGKFFFDEIYQALIVGPLAVFARACAWLDQWLVDGLVNLVGVLPGVLGTALRPLQNGLVQFYALVTILGLLVLLGAMMLS